MSGPSRTTHALSGAAVAAVLIAASIGTAAAQSAAPDPDGLTSADIEALHEYNLYAASQAARTGAAMLQAGYTKYAVMQFEKAVRLAPKVASYRQALAVARQRLASDAKRNAPAPVSLDPDANPDEGIQIPGFTPPASIAGAPGSATGTDENQSGDGSDGTGAGGIGGTGDSGTSAGSQTDGQGSTSTGTPAAATGTAADSAGATAGVDSGASLLSPGPVTGAKAYDVPMGTIPGYAPQRPTGDPAIRPIERRAGTSGAPDGDPLPTSPTAAKPRR